MAKKHGWYKTTDDFARIGADKNDKPDVDYRPELSVECAGCGATCAKRDVITGEYKWKIIDGKWYCEKCLAVPRGTNQGD